MSAPLGAGTGATAWNVVEESRHQAKTETQSEKLCPDTLDAAQLEEIAAAAQYTGSAAHKNFPWNGEFKPRSDASKCEAGIDVRTAETWLRDAIARGAVDEVFEDGFPRHVWYRADGVAYEARHNRGPSGAYHGYPIEDYELPDESEGRIL